jgi:hypothetical protein
VVDILVQNSNLTVLSNQSSIIGNPLVTLQIASTTNISQSDMIQKALSSKLIIVNFTECEKKIRNLYNINENTSLIFSKIDYSNKLDLNSIGDNSASDSTTFSLFDTTTRQFFNFSDCNNTYNSIKFPLKNESMLNLDKYYALSQEDINIFNPNDPAFISRCKKLKDNITDFDTTINYRRTNYFQNITAMCSNDCEFSHINKDKYVDCNCTNLSGEEFSNSFVQFFLDTKPVINFDIVLCAKEIFIAVRKIFYT